MTRFTRIAVAVAMLLALAVPASAHTIPSGHNKCTDNHTAIANDGNDRGHFALVHYNTAKRIRTATFYHYKFVRGDGLNKWVSEGVPYTSKSCAY